MAPNTSAWLSALILVATLAGCSASPDRHYIHHEEGRTEPANVPGSEDRANYVTAKERAMAREYAAMGDRQLREAYEKGARDTLEDFKGRMNARAGFVWEPPLIEMVEMPAAQVNGAIYPAHRTPVIIRPGRWVEENGIALPNLEGGR